LFLHVTPTQHASSVGHGRRRRRGEPAGRPDP
jgi:hypothetical protein